MNRPKDLNDCLDPALREALDQPWALGTEGFLAVAKEFQQLDPFTRLLEFGSGVSTQAFAKCFPDLAIHSIDHDPQYAFSVPAELQDRVHVTISPLKTRIVDGAICHTYEWNPEGVFDAVLVDGPPGASINGRLGSLLLGFRALRIGGTIILDDCVRPEELRAASDFAKMHGLSARLIGYGHGLIAFTKTKGLIRNRHAVHANSHFLIHRAFSALRYPARLISASEPR